MPRNSWAKERERPISTAVYHFVVLFVYTLYMQINWYLNSDVYFAEENGVSQSALATRLSQIQLNSLSIFWFSISGEKLIWIRISIELNFFPFLFPHARAITFWARDNCCCFFASFSQNEKHFDTHADKWIRNEMMPTIRHLVCKRFCIIRFNLLKCQLSIEHYSPENFK